MVNWNHTRQEDNRPTRYVKGLKMMVFAQIIGVLVGIYGLFSEHPAQVIIGTITIFGNGFFLTRNVRWLWCSNVGPFRKNMDTFEAMLKSKVVQDFKATGVDVIYLDSYYWNTALSAGCMKGVTKYVNNSPVYGHLWLIKDLIGLEEYSKKEGFQVSVTGGSKQSWAVLDIDLPYGFKGRKRSAGWRIN